MRAYKEFTKSYLAPQFKTWRKKWGFTQEAMAEKLWMASRSYADLERGKSGLSATTLLFFLGMLPEEEALQIVKGFGKAALRLESHEVA